MTKSPPTYTKKRIIENHLAVIMDIKIEIMSVIETSHSPNVKGAWANRIEIIMEERAEKEIRRSILSI